MQEVLLQIHEPGQTPDPHEGGESIAVGIDLGTTNSVVATSTDGKPEVLRDDDGTALIPSLVAYAADGSPIVGGLAKTLLLDRPDCVVGSIKRLMGRGPESLKELAGALPYDVDVDSDGTGGMVRLNLGGRSRTPVEISADILGALRERSEDILGKDVSKAVVTVPAYFDDAARHATKDAARLAGLEVLRLVNEPTAAALAYGLDKGAEGLYAVYDLGGGTFDISLLHMEMGVFQVLATGGDAALGGDDFDHALAEHFLEQRHRKEDAPLTASEAKVVLMTARVAKECLTNNPGGEWMLDVGGRESLHQIGRADFEDLIRPQIERTIELCRAVLNDAGMAPEDVKGVALVGGSTRVPVVRKMVGELFGSEPLTDIDPDEVVAVGAALQAEALTTGSGALLLDVTPLSLGIETMGGLVEKVIFRNTPIPVAKAQEFTTFKDGQTAIAIHVVQGERETVDQCRSLARFELRGIPPMTAGAAHIRVTFQVDADGLLTVHAREETTKVEQWVEVKPSYGISQDQMSKMLYDSLKYAKEDMQTRMLTEARVEARRVYNALAAALGKDGDLLSADEAAKIHEAMMRLDEAIEGDSRDAINKLIEYLDGLTKPFAQRRMDRGIGDALAGHRVDEFTDGD